MKFKVLTVATKTTIGVICILTDGWQTPYLRNDPVSTVLNRTHRDSDRHYKPAFLLLEMPN